MGTAAHSRPPVIAAPASETPSAPTPAAEEIPADAPLENGANVWDESAEAAFLGEQREQGFAPPKASPQAVEQADTTPLPKLDELVNRIPPETRALMDELFRAKFVAVRRVPKESLKE